MKAAEQYFLEVLAPVVQRVDNFIQWISRYPPEEFLFHLLIWPDFCKATHFIVYKLLLFS